MIFVSCILLLFLLARIMLFFNPRKMGLVDALDLDTDGLVHAGRAAAAGAAFRGDDHGGA